MPEIQYSDIPNLMAMMTGDEKHAEAAHSTVDVLWVLYTEFLRVTPEWDLDRDRFYLSKGHGPMALYAILAARGFFDTSDLAGFGDFKSRLGHHPDRVLVPGVEISSGSLGQGLPLAVGTALGLRARQLTSSNVWVLIGDGELDEGSNAEAIAYAGRLGLDRLHAVVIDNFSSSHGWPGGIEKRFELEGWSVARVDGTSHRDLAQAFSVEHDTRPHAVVAEIKPS